MRIVFCIKNLAGISGGAEWVLASVANGLAARGQEVHVVSFDEEGQLPFYEFSASVQIKNLGHANRGKKGSATQFWKMRNHVKSLHPDVILGFYPPHLSFYQSFSGGLHIGLFLVNIFREIGTKEDSSNILQCHLLASFQRR